VSVRTCRCGHDSDVHGHYRRGSDCSVCPATCSAYRPVSRVRVWVLQWLGRSGGSSGRRATIGLTAGATVHPSALEPLVSFLLACRRMIKIGWAPRRSK
jgi:hypothetical protein